MAARGAGAAGRAGAAHRRAHVLDRRRCGRTGPPRGVRTGAEAIGLERRPQPAHRHPLGHGRRHSQARGGIGRARAGRPRGCDRHRNRGAVAAGDPHRADRVRDCHRPGRRRFRREPGTAGRQRDRVHDLRIQHERKMAGAAQGDRAPRDAGGGPSGSGRRLRDRAVRRRPDRGAVVGGGGEPGRRARCRRDRARRHGIRARLEWRPDRDGKRIGDRSSRTDRHAGGPAPAARGLPRPLLRHRRWPHLLRA